MTETTATTRPERHYLKCEVCTEPVAYEGRVKGFPACSYCGGKMRYMGQVTGNRWNRTETRTACDERCTQAQGPACDCQCHGANHGTGRVVTVVVESGVARITTPNDPKVAERVARTLALAAEFDRRLAETTARLDTACAEVRSAKRAGEYLRGDRWRLYVEGTALQAELHRISGLKTPKGRLEALGQIDALVPAPAAEVVPEVSVEPESPMAPVAPAPEPVPPAKPGCLMGARYAGICPDCKTAIRVGQPIYYERTARRAVHAECPSGDTWVRTLQTPEPAPDCKSARVPTPQQAEAIDLYRDGSSLAIKALAGTGKTALLEMMAAATPERACLYTAFNRSIVQEATGRMPKNVSCSTAHSLAFQGIMRMLGASAGRRYLDRRPATSGGHGVRQPGRVVAQILGISDFGVTVKGETIVISAAALASNVLEALGRFCNSAEAEPTVRHFPKIEGIDLPLNNGTPTYENNNKVHAWLLKYLVRAWEDLTAPVGKLTLSHDAYFKLWELGGPTRTECPVIPAKVIFFDEAQDASPVMVSVMTQQPEETQIVWVGDPHQEIYGFRGAINALDNVPSERQCSLTWSFRFGPAIAAVGNGPLQILGTDLRLEGRGSASSRTGILAEPRAILCRSNAGAVEAVLEAMDAGQRPHLIGGGKAIEFFCEEALRLMETGRSSHPDLAAFGSWGDVQDYVERDGSGADLKLLVKLIDQYGAGRILAAMRNMPKEPDADLVVSTVHKTKGREWLTVQVRGDFGKFDLEEDNPADLADEELRVLYVAATRAREVLDYSRCKPLVAIMRDLEEDARQLTEAEPVA